MAGSESGPGRPRRSVETDKGINRLYLLVGPAARTLAVGNVIGGNVFDTLLVGVLYLPGIVLVF